MKYTSSLFYTLVAILFLLNLSNCEREKIDPCSGLKEVSAAFEIYDSQQLAYPEGYKPIDTDTVVNNWVEFNALEENAIYEWKLGAETITVKRFKRRDFPRGTIIDVSLKVTKKPNLSCFPKDDGVDEVARKFFTTTNYTCDSKIAGSFEGYDEDEPSKKRTIRIEPCTVYQPGNIIYLTVNNLVPGCGNEGFAFLRDFITYKQVAFGAIIQCNNPTGLVTISGTANDKITIEYYVLKDIQGSFDDKANRTYKKFVGQRRP